MCENAVYSELAYLDIINLNKPDPVMIKNEWYGNHEPYNVSEEDWCVVKVNAEPTIYPTIYPNTDSIELYEDLNNVIQKYDLIINYYYY